MFVGRFLSLLLPLLASPLATAAAAPYKYEKLLIQGPEATLDEVTVAYIHSRSTAEGKSKGTLLLIHGYPENAYEFRHVIRPFNEAGYDVVAPDMRGAGYSSKPITGYDKVTVASDFHTIIRDHLKIEGKVHVVGHDIGGTVAYAYASRYANETASIVFGEFILPGTIAYDKVVLDQAYGKLWHNQFHWQHDLAETLVQGKERIYLTHFYHRLSYNPAAFTAEDIDHYTAIFSEVGAMRAGFALYRAFFQDAKDNRAWWRDHGKTTVPCLNLNGADSYLSPVGNAQTSEAFESHENAEIQNSGHWTAEENPEDFVKMLLEWFDRH